MEAQMLNIIEGAIKDQLHVSREQIISPCREQEVVWGRIFFGYFAQKYLLWTERQIGVYLGKNRTAQYHYMFVHGNLYRLDKKYTEVFDRVDSVVAGQISAGNLLILRPEEEKRVEKFNRGMLVGVDN